MLQPACYLEPMPNSVHASRGPVITLILSPAANDAMLVNGIQISCPESRRGPVILRNRFFCQLPP